MDNREEVLMELTRFESARQSDIPPVLEDYLRHVARTGDSVFPWPKVRPLLKRKLDLIADQYCQHSPPEKIPAMPNVDPFKYEQLRTEIHFRIDSLNGTPFTIQRLCELMTEPQRYYKRTDKFMRGVEKNVLVVTTIEATRRRPPPEAVNGAVGPEEEAGVASRGVPSTSGAGRPPEPRAGHSDDPDPADPADEPPATAATAEEAMETNGESAPVELAPAAATADTVSTSGAISTDSQTPMELGQPAAEAPVTSDSAPVTSEPAAAATVQPAERKSEQTAAVAVEMTSEQTEVTSQTDGSTSESVGLMAEPVEASEERQAAAPVDLTAAEATPSDCQQTASAQPADSPVTVATEHVPAAASEPGPASEVLPSTDIQAPALVEVPSEPSIDTEHLSNLSTQSSDSSEHPSNPSEHPSNPPEQPSNPPEHPPIPRNIPPIPRNSPPIPESKHRNP